MIHELKLKLKQLNDISPDKTIVLLQKYKIIPDNFSTNDKYKMVDNYITNIVDDNKILLFETINIIKFLKTKQENNMINADVLKHIKNLNIMINKLKGKQTDWITKATDKNNYNIPNESEINTMINNELNTYIKDNNIIDNNVIKNLKNDITTKYKNKYNQNNINQLLDQYQMQISQYNDKINILEKQRDDYKKMIIQPDDKQKINYSINLPNKTLNNKEQNIKIKDAKQKNYL